MAGATRPQRPPRLSQACRPVCSDRGGRCVREEGGETREHGQLLRLQKGQALFLASDFGPTGAREPTGNPSGGNPQSPENAAASGQIPGTLAGAGVAAEGGGAGRQPAGPGHLASLWLPEPGKPLQLCQGLPPDTRCTREPARAPTSPQENCCRSQVCPPSTSSNRSISLTVTGLGESTPGTSLTVTGSPSAAAGGQAGAGQGPSLPSQWGWQARAKPPVQQKTNGAEQSKRLNSVQRQTNRWTDSNTCATHSQTAPQWGAQLQGPAFLSRRASYL